MQGGVLLMSWNRVKKEYWFTGRIKLWLSVIIRTGYKMGMLLMCSNLLDNILLGSSTEGWMVAKVAMIRG